MSEYNIQMNKYNALNAEYDQLYPKPMKHANTHAKDGSDPITPASIGAYTKGETDTLLSSKPNPNLLDNWYFGNPIDQRQGRIVKPNTTYYSDNQLTTAASTTSAYVTAYRYATGTASGVNYASFKLTDSDSAPTYYAAPENVVRGYANFSNNTVYSIDRWILRFGYVLIKDGYITWGNEKATGACQYTQIIPISVLPGKRLSYSILTTNGVYTNTVIAPSVGNYIQSTVNIEGITFSVRVYCNDNGTAELVLRRDSTIFSLNLVGIKLELGTTQTLAHQDADGKWQLNELPNYADTLMRCQRYQLVLPFVGQRYSAVLNYAAGQAFIPTPTTMRANPRIEKIGDSPTDWGACYIAKDSMRINAISTTGTVSGNGVAVMLTSLERNDYGGVGAWGEVGLLLDANL